MADLDKQKQIEIKSKFVCDFLGALGDSTKALGRPGLKDILPVGENAFKIYCSEEIATKNIISYYDDYLGCYRLSIAKREQDCRSCVLSLYSTIETLQRDMQMAILKKQRKYESILAMLNFKEHNVANVVELQNELENIEDDIARIIQEENQRIFNLQMQYTEKCNLMWQYSYVREMSLRISSVKKATNSDYLAYIVEVEEGEPKAAQLR